MAVIPMWQVDRDKSMHTSKTEADKHDLMLEIGEHFAAAIQSVAPEVAQSHAEVIGLFFSKHRDAVSKLCKGSNEGLEQAIAELSAGNVTAIRAVQ